jgi:hypothetical protein
MYEQENEPHKFVHRCAKYRFCLKFLRFGESEVKKFREVLDLRLPAESFAHVGDVDDPSTWHLPIHCPGNPERTAELIRLSLVGWPTLSQFIPNHQQEAALNQLLGAAQSFGIEAVLGSDEDIEEAIGTFLV